MSDQQRPLTPWESDPDLITRHEAAALVGCGLRTLFTMRAEGRFPEGTVEVFQRHSRGNPFIRYRKTKLEQFLANDWHRVGDDQGEASDGDAETGE